MSTATLTPPQEINENKEMIAQMVRDFCAKEIEPNKMKWDETESK